MGKNTEKKPLQPHNIPIEHAELPITLSPVKTTGNPYNRFNTTKEKSGIVVPVSPASKALLDEACVKQVPGHRPIQTVSPNGKHAQTPNGTYLYFKDSYGDVKIFAQTNTIHVEESVCQSAFLDLVRLRLLLAIDIFHGVARVHNDTPQEAEITKNTLRQVKNKFIQNNRQRKPVQSVAVADPNAEVRSVPVVQVRDELFEQSEIDKIIAELKLSASEEQGVRRWIDRIKCEWTHLIGHEIIGDAGQIPSNLIFGTVENNSKMMVVEALVKFRIERDDFVKLKVGSDRIDGGPIATAINYSVIAADGTEKIFSFDPFSCNKPHVRDFVYVMMRDKLEQKKRPTNLLSKLKSNEISETSSNASMESIVNQAGNSPQRSNLQLFFGKKARERLEDDSQELDNVNSKRPRTG